MKEKDCKKIQILKSNNGVTLIALIVTIMILIILAGVSIASLIGDDGIVNEANDAKNQATIASEQEEITLAFNKVKLKKVDDGESSIVTSTELRNELQSKGLEFTNVTTMGNDNTLEITMASGNKHYISQKGTISNEYKGETVSTFATGYFTYTVNSSTKTATITGLNMDCAESTAYYTLTREHVRSNSFSALKDENGNYIEDLKIPSKVIYKNITYTVTAIANYAFYIDTYGNNIAYIENGFKTITIPNTITSIGDKAFANYVGLTEVIIPSSVTSMGANVFSATDLLIINSTAKSEPTSWSSSWYNGCDAMIYWNENYVGKYTDPKYFAYNYDSVSKTAAITGFNPAYAESKAYIYKVKSFENYSSIKDDNGNYITTVSIPPAVKNGDVIYKITSIGDRAFYLGDKDGSYQEITIEDGFNKIILPKTITKIGDYAFYNYHIIKEITLPNTLKSIEPSAFYGCNKLHIIHYVGTDKEWGDFKNSYYVKCYYTPGEPKVYYDVIK